ncbi:Uncharacterized conserved protein YybS, DUF2232 family [Anoxynatronum buryatiense]|uniref:Uncharacterized conserved protein YybS, DUF2232 family n=2 Tax=Anoxynatronum buryatiense TaxID=489973 RepID=A0AA45WWG7_9CLOT|nr:Uncharacterized conserved protein YybS, DUF2232 family [Anoxynatronum buryatiense]
MEFHQNRKALTETAMIATLTSIFVVSTFYIPLLSILLALIPMPFMVLAVRRGSRYAFFALVMVTLIIGLLTGVIYSLFALVIFGPMALAMGWWIRHRKEPHEVIFIGAVGSAAAIFTMMQLIAMASGIQLTLEISQMITGIMEQQAAALQQMNLEVVALEEAVHYLLLVFPGLILIQSLFGAFVNYYLTMAVLRRFTPSEEPLPEFSRFRLPGHVVSGVFLLMALSWGSQFIHGINHISLLANVTLIAVMIFFMQGISLISYWIKGTRVPKWVRLVILVILVILSPMITLISLLGLVDVLADFRKLTVSK